MKMIPIYITTVLVVSNIVGCSSFPEEGRGGLAENYAASDFSPVMPEEPLGPEHGLRFDWKLTKLQLDSLIQEGAKWCFPAAVVQAKEKQSRIARELEGGLLLDAANDLVIQRKRLNELELQLDYVTSQTHCEPPKNQFQLNQQLAVVDQLYSILNVDNQFALDSTEINPKYMGNLAKAANMLVENSTLKLSVTGHADSQGNNQYNQKLAMGRAKQVKRYLTIFGLSPSRISTHSLGAELPLFDGDTPATMLTNRRVSIEIISTQDHSVTASLGGMYE